MPVSCGSGHSGLHDRGNGREEVVGGAMMILYEVNLICNSLTLSEQGGWRPEK